VPLSEREQKILQEIERDLYREDPGFARDVHKRPRLQGATRARLGVLVFLAGLLALVAFFVVTLKTESGLSLLLGVAGFGAMVAGIVMFVGSIRSQAASQSRPRERLAGAVRRWEERIRERYRDR
jgi:hypothetical protein